MLLRIRETGQVVTEYEFRQLNNTTSFSDQLTIDNLDLFGADPVLPAPQPTPGEFETVSLNGAVKDSKGNWIENWVITPMFSKYTDADGKVHTVSQQQQEYTANKLNQQRQFMVLTPLQAKAALLQAGLLNTVETMIDDPTTDPLIKLAWNNALEYKRLSPMIVEIASKLNISDQQLDDLFTSGKSIIV